MQEIVRRRSAPHAFKLTRSWVLSTAVLIGHYEREGNIKIADAALAKMGKAEQFLQERMTREG